jgi:hypothetical protein
MKTTVRHLVHELSKLKGNSKVYLAGDPNLYLYQHTDKHGNVCYTLDTELLQLDEPSDAKLHLLHDFQGVEQPTKKWATAIAKRIFEEPESLVEFAIEQNDTTIAALLLKPDETPYSVAIMTKRLLANPQYIYQLIGTSVIEEGYFDGLN